jgi:drug/metabolite transporter (DMT)-like permease
MSEETESPLSSLYKLKHVWGLLIGAVALVLGGALIVTGIMSPSLQNIGLFAALVVLMVLPVYRRLGG